MSGFSHYNLRKTSELLEHAEKLMKRIEAGRQISSGSGAGKSATYDLDSLDELQSQLDDIIDILQLRGENGDKDVPQEYIDIKPEITRTTGDFRC